MIRILAPAACLLPLLTASAGEVPATRRVVYAMGTRLHLQTSGAAAALAEVERIEAACSTWRPDSVWARLNAAEGAWLPMDREWLDLLARALEWSGRTGGSFDPALLALLRARGLRPGESGTGAFGFRLLDLDPIQGRARLRQGAGLDEGAFLKGHALDAARRAARSESGWMDFGGQLLAWGAPLRVEIADPVRRLRPRVSLMLRNASLSTSGCSERGRHIVDPRSGEVCPAWGSVSVVAASAFEADVLSTALYVMGPETGSAWAEARGHAALFLLNDGTRRATPAFLSLRPTFLHGARA